MKKKIINVSLIFVLLFALAVPINSVKAQTLFQEYTGQKEFQTRNREQIDSAWKALMENQGIAGNKVEYIEEPNTDTYTPGKVSQKSLEEGLNQINFFRFLAGLNTLTLDEEYTQRSQAAAMLQNKLGYLNHEIDERVFPDAPESARDVIRAGSLGSRNSNLAFGDTTFTSSLYGYILDDTGQNLTRQGHRFAFLNPDITKTGLGQSGLYSAMYIRDSEKSGLNYDFTTYPARGDFPIEYWSGSGREGDTLWYDNFPLEQIETPWTIRFNTHKYQRFYIPDLTITITRTSDNKSFTIDANTPVSPEKEGGAFRTIKSTDGYIIFRPDLDFYGTYEDMVGETFRVEVSGIKNSDGSPAQINYDVNFYEYVRQYTENGSCVVLDDSKTEARGIYKGLTIQEMIDNINTNYSPRVKRYTVYNADGSQVTDFQQLVQDGMRLTISKNNYNIKVITSPITDFNLVKQPSPAINGERRDTFVKDQVFDIMNDGKIHIKRKNGNEQDITITKDMLSGYDMGQTGKQTVTLTFEDKTLTFDIEITDKQLDSIVWKDNKVQTEYLEGKETSLILNDSTIGLLYNNGIEEAEVIPLTLDMISDYDLSQVGEQQLTVTYKDKTLDLIINVLKKSPIGMAITTMPKTVFVKDSTFSTIGGKLTVYYNNDTSNEVDLEENMCSGYNLSNTGDQLVTVEHEGMSSSYKITVVEALLGDVNRDGQINILDFNSIKRYITGDKPMTDDIKAVSDINNDGKVNVIDLVSLKNIIIAQ